MAQASRPVPAADETRAALEDVSDPAARAVVLALLEIRDELRTMSERESRVEARLKQMNQYLGALANKP
ncbi:hypothetical protein [Streptomyces sp. NPDC088757]|uniref:hypothetical protein n=1 Tax=Streptomyces sp. NPDC088757 TaxID=3365889 RepID=UPI0037FB3B2A